MSEKTYTLSTALFDLFMVVITGGLWLFYLLIRYIRTH